MAVAVKRIPMSPMYKKIWDSIEKVRKNNFFTQGKIIPISNRFAFFERTGSFPFQENIYNCWLHICKPRKLASALNDANVTTEMVNCYANSNFLKDTKCSKCNYKLTKQEQLMLKFVLLGEKR